MNYNEQTLFYLLRIGLGTESKYDFNFTHKPDWKFIYELSSANGILAILFDGLEYIASNNLIPEEMLPARKGKMRWAMNSVNIEKLNVTQYKIASELADIYAENGIKTVVLKGIASASMYPKPSHRPCGDLDCFLYEDFERGIDIAVSNGGVYGGRDIKHAHIKYKGLEIENHKYCTSISGPRKRKDFERNLQAVLNESAPVSINGSNLLLPNPLFNALFLTEHSWRHFLGEEVKLRQYCDFAMLLKLHNDEIDWNRFAEIINARDKNLLSFAKCVSVICHKLMGTPIPPIFADNCEIDDLTMKMVRSILYDADPENVFVKGFFKHRYLVIKRSLKRNWRNKVFCEDSPFYKTFLFLWAHVFERHPHL